MALRGVFESFSSIILSLSHSCEHLVDRKALGVRLASLGGAEDAWIKTKHKFSDAQESERESCVILRF